MLKQTTPSGCGLYAVANALNMPDFITTERLEESKKGNNIGQLSRWLDEDAWLYDGFQYYIDAIYYNHFGQSLASSCFRLRPKRIDPNADQLLLPILLLVRFSENGKNHMIGGHINEAGILTLFDSLKQEPEKTTLAKVNRTYYHVYGLFIFHHYSDGSYLFLTDKSE